MGLTLLHMVPRTTSEFVGRLFESRTKKNPSYSVRAFARDCGVSPASLSQVLNGKARLSGPNATKIARKLKLEPRNRELLDALVEHEAARSETRKKTAQLKLLRFMSLFDGRERDNYHLIADWYHLPICELTELKGFRSSPSWIASRLGITPSQASEAIERLLRLGILTEDQGGELRKAAPNVVIPDGPYSTAIRASHRSFLELALKTLVDRPAEKIVFSSTVVRARSGEIEKAREEMKTFRQKLMLDLESGEGHDGVHVLGMQFFELG